MGRKACSSFSSTLSNESSKFLHDAIPVALVFCINHYFALAHFAELYRAPYVPTDAKSPTPSPSKPDLRAQRQKQPIQLSRRRAPPPPEGGRVAAGGLVVSEVTAQLSDTVRTL